MQNLQELRKQIDKVDAELIELIRERGELVEQVTEFKSVQGLPALDPKRKRQMIQERRLLAVKAGLDPNFVEKLFKQIHDYFVELEKRVLA